MINPYPSKVIYLDFQPLEIASRYRDPFSTHMPRCRSGEPPLSEVRITAIHNLKLLKITHICLI